MRKLGSDFFALKTPRAIAHRGASGEFPENTLESFRAAALLHVPYIECDLHMTRDGILVMNHDADLLRTCGRAGRIDQLDYSEILQANAGYGFSRDGGFPFRESPIHIPTLEDVLAALPEMRFIIEIKQTEPSLDRPMLDVIEHAGMARRVLIASEHQKPLDELRALWPEIPTSFSANEVANFFAALASGMNGYVPPADALQVPPTFQSMRLVSKESIAAAHNAGLEMHVWTVNQEAEMRELLALGVDGILSDVPDRLLMVIEAM
ncbi:MAG: glycerophosphodiester phosphodiesterase [Candidatus Binataceae bacterium]